MEEESRVLTGRELFEILLAEAQGPQAAQALALLESLVAERGLNDTDLETLARIDSYCDPAVNTAALSATVKAEMVRRGIWKRFRRRERLRVWWAATRWTAGLLLMAAATLAAVFGVIIAAKWILYWMGF